MILLVFLNGVAQIAELITQLIPRSKVVFSGDFSLSSDVVQCELLSKYNEDCSITWQLQRLVEIRFPKAQGAIITTLSFLILAQYSDYLQVRLQTDLQMYLLELRFNTFRLSRNI